MDKYHACIQSSEIELELHIASLPKYIGSQVSPNLEYSYSYISVIITVFNPPIANRLRPKSKRYSALVLASHLTSESAPSNKNFSLSTSRSAT